MGIRKPLIAVSILVLLAGLGSAVARQLSPGGTDAFNLGVDFTGGSVVTAKFKDGNPTNEQIREALRGENLLDTVIQDSTDKTDEVLIKIPLIEGVSSSEESSSETSKDESAGSDDESGASKEEAGGSENETESAGNTENDAGATSGERNCEQSENQVTAGRCKVARALDTFGKEAPAGTSLAEAKDAKYQIVGTDSVGPVAGEQLRNQAVIATLLGMVGILLFIAFRYDWTYAAGAVIAVFHDVLITLAFFTMFQWEVSLTVLAAFLTLVGFSEQQMPESFLSRSFCPSSSTRPACFATKSQWDSRWR